MYNKYKLINQKPYYCVPAVLQMIFNRYDIELDIDTIAEELNFQLSKELREKHNINIGSVTEDPINFGCNVSDLNTQIFEKFSLPFRENYISYNRLSYNYLNFLLNNYLMEEENNFIAGVHYGELTNNPDANGRHAILLEGIDGDNVFYISPEEERKGGTCREVAKLENLLDAIIKAKDGLWMIKYTK